MEKYLCAVLLVLLLCFTFACQNKADNAELEKFRTQAKVEEQNKASFRYWLEETDKDNYAAWDKVCSADYVSHFAGMSWNLEEHKQANRPFLVAFPDIKHGIDYMIAEADRVSVRLTLTGTHKGEFMRIPPTGNKIKYTAMLEGRFSEGKIVEVWGTVDLLTLMQQLGLELKPKEIKK
jgi:predicted ester cyclase